MLMFQQILYFNIILQITLLYYHIHGLKIPIEKCLKQFLITDYQFIQIQVSQEAAKCIVSKTSEEFGENCPERGVFFNETLYLDVYSEFRKKSNYYIFNEEVTNFVEDINIAEQLILDLDDCPHKSVLKLDYGILQVIHKSEYIHEYGYIFFVPDGSVTPVNMIFGFVMVPYKEMRRSAVLNERHYNTINETIRFFYTKNIYLVVI